jgi:RNA polymerase sigma-70 factor (ECF subfamily)
VDAESDKHHDQAAPRVETSVPATTAFLDGFEMLKRVVAGLGLGTADAQDVLQDVYLQASQQGKSLPAGQARAWLVRVTVNRAMLEHRRRKRVHQATVRAAWDRTERETPQPDVAAERSEDLAAVRRAMQDLDESLMVVLSLRYFADLDSTQIGEALDLPPSTVRRRLHDARLILARQLTEKGFGP